MPAPHDLSIRQLQYIVAVADTLGFHRAAARCHVSQPTLSTQLRQLEELLGVTLFERDKRRVLVTPAGERLVERARRVLIELEDLLEVAARIREPFSGVVRLGVIPTIAPYLLPEIAPPLHKRFPKMQIVYQEQKTALIVADLQEGRLDAGLVALEADLGGCDKLEIASDPFVVALSAEHPLAAKKKIAEADLDGETVLLLDDGHCFRSQALAVCGRASAREASLRATSLGTLVQMVAAGSAITLLPSSAVAVENRRAQLEIRPFTKPEPRRTLGLIWRHGSPVAAIVPEVAKVMKQALPSLR